MAVDKHSERQWLAVVIERQPCTTTGEVMRIVINVAAQPRVCGSRENGECGARNFQQLNQHDEEHVHQHARPSRLRHLLVRPRCRLRTAEGASHGTQPRALEGISTIRQPNGSRPNRSREAEAPEQPSKEPGSDAVEAAACRLQQTADQRRADEHVLGAGADRNARPERDEHDEPKGRRRSSSIQCERQREGRGAYELDHQQSARRCAAGPLASIITSRRR
eukprot:3071335-Prymnesium_polylepis.2